MNQVTTRYELDINSSTWKAIAEWIDARVAMHQTNLAIFGTSMEETENIRGALEELRELRSQAEPRTIPVELTDLELAQL